MFSKLSIYHKYIYFLLLFTIIPMLFAFGSTYFLLSNRMVEQIKENELHTLNEYQNKIDIVLEGIESTSSQLAINFSRMGSSYRNFINMPIVEQLAILGNNQSMIINNTFISSIYIVFGDENRMIIDDKFTGFDYFKDKQWIETYENMNTNQTQWLAPREIQEQYNSDIYIGATFVRPFYIAGNDKRGYIAINVDTQKLMNTFFLYNNTYLVTSPSEEIIFTTKDNNENSYKKIRFNIISPLNDWNYSSIVYENELLKPLEPIKAIIILILVIFIIVLTILSLKASNILYKPIKELVDLLKSNSTTKDNELNSKNEMFIIKEYFINQIAEKHTAELIVQKNRTLIYENEIRKILRGRIDEIETSDSALFINHAKEFFVIVFEDYSQSLTEKGDTISSNIKAHINNAIDMHYKYVGAEISTYLFAIIVYFEQMVNEKEEKGIIYDICGDILRRANSSGIENISIGIGNTVDNINDIQNSYIQALEASKCRILSKNIPVVFFSHISKTINTDFWSYPIELENKIIAAIRDKNLSEIEKLVSQLVDRISVVGIPIHHILSWLNSMRDSIFGVPSLMGYTLDEIFSTDYHLLYNKLILSKNIMDVQNYFIEICNKLIDGLNDRISDKYSVLIDDIKTYIIENIGDDISLSAVSDKFGISSTYLSAIFKQSTGENFIKYIIAVKMEFAGKLLSQTNMSISEIAQKTGYLSDNSFYNAFKKYMGKTPNQYRLEYKRNNIQK